MSPGNLISVETWQFILCMAAILGLIKAFLDK